MTDMTPMQQLTVKHVRNLMKQFGKNQIYTNKYDHGVRTVKCYLGNTNECLFTKQVNDVCRQIGVVGVTVKVTYQPEPIKMWGPHSSIIVRIPATV